MQSAGLKVAAVVNGAARAVNKNVIDYLKNAADQMGVILYISDSIPQAKVHAREILSKNMDVVMCGGGDGTFKQCMTNIMELKPGKPPAFGVLSLGTGNSIASAVGASPIVTSPFGNFGAEEELRQAMDPVARAVKRMLVVDGIYTPFAGIGLDSWILSYYEKTKKFFDRIPIMPKRLRGKWDYFWAVMLSMWPFMRNPLPEVIIRNEGGRAYQINQEGDQAYQAIPPGGIMYRGKISFCAASSIRYYGWGIRLFPQANTMIDSFQLRVAALNFGETVNNLPALFSGELFGPKVFDFSCQKISIELAETPTAPPGKSYKKRYERNYHDGIPFQVGGDLVGKQRLIHIDSGDITVVIGSKKPPKSPT